MMRKFAVTALILILAINNTACAQEQELIRQDLWKNPDAVDYLGENTLPSSYDLRPEGRVPPVKDQDPWGTCWAFAATASMESTYMTAHESADIDLSEMFPAWFVYKSPGEGKSFGLPNPRKDILHQSGTAYQINAIFSRLGTVSEDVLPYPSGKSSYQKPDKLPEEYDKTDIILQESYQLGMIKGDAMIKLVKKLIITKGAVYAHYYSRDSVYHKGSRGTSYFNNSKSSRNTNHAVILIGWDDNYSRENFKTHPAKNGAWLVQNSRGSSWGDNGCFWLSYEQYIDSAALFIAEKELTRTKHYGYDDLGCTGGLGSKNFSAWAANVFRSGGHELLTEIAFYTMDNNATCEAYIYRLGKEKPLSPVSASCSASIPETKIKFAGYHRVKLPESLELNEGEYFSVVINMLTPDYKYPIAIETRTGINKSVLVNENESYFAISDSDSKSGPSNLKWYEGVKDFPTPRNACIKAFTVEINN